MNLCDLSQNKLKTSVLFLLLTFPACLGCDGAGLSPSIKLGYFGDQPCQAATGATHGPPRHACVCRVPYPAETGSCMCRKHFCRGCWRELKLLGLQSWIQRLRAPGQGPRLAGIGQLYLPA